MPQTSEARKPIRRTRHDDDVAHAKYMACDRKIRYATMADAETLAVERPFPDKIPLRPYICTFCAGWHLTKKPNDR